MSDIESALLAEVITRPDMDYPRLIYADWLEEHGQVERAELIRVQCELAGMETNGLEYWSGQLGPVPKWVDRVIDLRRRERELLDENRLTWLPRALMDVESQSASYACQYRRGFVEEITLNWPAWHAHARALLAAAPLAVVRLTTEPPGVEYVGDHRHARLVGGSVVFAFDTGDPTTHGRPMKLHALAAEYAANGRPRFELPPVQTVPYGIINYPTYRQASFATLLPNLGESDD